MADREVQVLYAGQEVARRAQSPLRRSSVIERSHLAGIVANQWVGTARLTPPPAAAPAELQRDLVEYEALVGGGW